MLTTFTHKPKASSDQSAFMQAWNRGRFSKAALLACATWAVVGVTQPAAAQTLYDPGLATLPGAQGWVYIPLGIVSQTIVDGKLQFSTTTLNGNRGGYARTDMSIDSTQGTTLGFDLTVVSESHTNNNRSGFSVILLDQSAHGIELGFWSTEIWAQSGPDFIKAESFASDTSVPWHYELTLQGGQYSLRQSGTTVLTGAMRDYSSFGAPYNTSNFIFLGDNAGSSMASVSIGSIALTSAVPEPGEFLMSLVGLASLASFARSTSRRRTHPASQQ